MRRRTFFRIGWIIALGLAVLLLPVMGQWLSSTSAHATWRTIPTTGFPSDPFGQVWSLVGGEGGQPLFAATVRYFDGAGEMSGHAVYRSDDGGDHWYVIDTGMEGQLVQLLSGGMPGQPLFAATNMGWVYRTDDGGLHWQRVGDRFPTPVHTLLGGTTGHPLFALQDSSGQDSALYRLDDGGDHWRPVIIGDRTNQVLQLVGAPPTTPIIAVTHQGMYRSPDEGQTWRLINATFTSDKVDSLLGGTPDDLLITIIRDDQGATHMERSADHGDTWQISGPVRAPLESWQIPMPPQIWFVGGHSGLPLYRITREGASRSDDSGRTWQHMPNSGMDWSAVGILIGKPGQPLFAVSGSQSSGGIYRSDDDGAHWRLTTGLNGSAITEITGGAYGAPLTVGTFVPGSRMSYSGDHFRSDDGGHTWSWVDSNAGVRDAHGVSGIGTDLGAGLDTCSVFSQIGGKNGQPLFAGTSCLGRNQGGLYRSDDGGATWAPTGSGLGDHGILDLSGGEAGQPLYVSIGVISMPMDGASGVYRSDDDGRSWYNISGWPITLRIDMLVISPDGETLLAAATDGRVFRSTNGGTQWQPAPDRTRATLMRSADVTPLTLAFRGDQIVIHHRTEGWSDTIANPLPGDGPTVFDYTLVGDHIVLVALDMPDTIQRAEITLPLRVTHVAR